MKCSSISLPYPVQGSKKPAVLLQQYMVQGRGTPWTDGTASQGTLRHKQDMPGAILKHQFVYHMILPWRRNWENLKYIGDPTNTTHIHKHTHLCAHTNIDRHVHISLWGTLHSFLREKP